MNKINQFIKVLGISSIILIGNTAFTTAGKIPGLKNDKRFRNSDDLIRNNHLNRLFIDKLPSSIKSNLESNQLSNSDSVFLELTSGKVAQASDSTLDKTAEIITQECIPSNKKLNPSYNSLSLPTKADEVEVNVQKSITLDQAIKLACKNNQEIQTARIQVERSQAELRQAKAQLFPRLGLGSNLDYRNAGFLDSRNDQIIDRSLEDNPRATREQIIEIFEGNSATGQFFSTNRSLNFSSDLTLNYNIYDSGNRGASIGTAEKELRITELELDKISGTIRTETASDYYDLQNSDAQVKIEEAAVEDANQTLKDAQLLDKAGLGTRFDVLRAEVELAQAHQRLTTAQANRNIARRQLAETLSIPHDSDLSTADEIEKAGDWNCSLPKTILKAWDSIDKKTAEEWNCSLLETDEKENENKKNDGLEQLLLQRKIGAEQRKIDLSEVRPSLDADAAYSVNDDFEDSFDTSDQYSVGLNLNWRLFDGGAARAGARQAEKDIEIAETQFANQRNEIRFNTEEAFFNLESAEKNIGTATKEVELAEESLRLGRLRFQAGVGTQTNVIEAQTQLTTARGNLLSSIIDYNQAYILLPH